MRSSKALDALGMIPDDEFERPEAPGPVEIDDRALVKALAEVAAAVRDRPDEAAEPDYTDALGAIAKGMNGLSAIRTEVAGLRGDVAALVRAVSEIKPTDMEPICEAIRSIVTAQKSLAASMTAPRVLTFDSKGEPNGVRIERPN